MKQRYRIFLALALVGLSIYAAHLFNQITTDLLPVIYQMKVKVVVYLAFPLLAITHVMDKLGKPERQKGLRWKGANLFK